MAKTDVHEFKLPQSLTIASCDKLLNKIIEAKSMHHKIDLDSSEVETIDTAGVQLICSFCADKDQVTHINMSEKVTDVMNGLGFVLV